MTDLPDYLDALEAALMALPEESEAMVLSQLDGFVAGLVVCPEPIPAEEWLPEVWGDDASDEAVLALFGDAERVTAVVGLILQHHAETARVLAEQPDDYGPIYDVAPETQDADPDDGEVMWQGWVLGFQSALALRPEIWEPLFEADEDDPARQALDALMALHDIATGESDLPPDTLAEMEAAAPDLLPALVISLGAWRDDPAGGAWRPTEPVRVTKIGRNDPCPCGSGKKYKKCCGAEG